MTQLTQQEDRILALLGQGLAETAVAAACGVTVSRISQMLSQEEFANKVSELRFANLSAHTARDNRYNSIEDQLLEKLEGSVGLMYRPMEILKSIQIINAAKRRGQSAPDSILQQQTVVNLQIPVKVVNKFQVSINKQVTNVDGQDLLTMPSSTLLSKSQKSQRVLNHDSGTEVKEGTIIATG